MLLGTWERYSYVFGMALPVGFVGNMGIVFVGDIAPRRDGIAIGIHRQYGDYPHIGDGIAVVICSQDVVQ